MERREEEQGVIAFDGGLRLQGTPLWLDASRPVPLSFLSNALAFRHQQRLVTSADTLQLLEGHLGASDALASPLRRRFSVGELILEMLPAGHIVGSAQLQIEHRGRSLLYCGALRRQGGPLGEPGQAPRAEVLVLNCPYDAAPYHFPGAKKTAEALLAWVHQVLDEGDQPILAASALGMAQEVCQLAATSGRLRVRAHRSVAQWNKRVRRCGVTLSPTPELRRPLVEGEVAVVPPSALGSPLLLRLAPRGRAALVSGRAVVAEEVERVGAEVGFPLSVHADARTLRAFVRETGASQVFLGPRHSARFEASLRRLGLEVTRFEGRRQDQLELFA